MAWRKVVEHQGLGKWRVVTASEQDLLEARASALWLTWESEWQRKKSQQDAATLKEQRKQLSLQNKAAAEASAAQQNQDLQAAQSALENLLKTTIEQNYIRDWSSLKDTAQFPKRAPTLTSRDPKPTPNPVPALNFVPTLLEKIVPSLKRKRIDLLEQQHSAAIANWKAEVDEINTQNLRQRQEEESRHSQLMQQFKAEKLQYELAQKQRNQQIDEQRERYYASETDALTEYWYQLFTDQAYPDNWPEDCQLQYIEGAKKLIVDYELPPIEAFPSVREVRYVASRKEFKEIPIPEAQRKKNYDDTLYQIALASLYKLFQSDAVDALELIVFNGWVQSVDKATGAAIHPCILSVQASKEDFMMLNMHQVDPRACFKKLKGVCGSRLVDMTPVQPIMSLDKEDRRFVNAYAVADSLGSETNLAAMDWQDFENLIRELFEKEFSQNGGEVKITQASRDGGVDAIAFDPDPIRGGKIVIQAKRYTNVVGVSAVRDLYGTVHNEGATKGILVTTADFGKDAHDFANGKPLKLLSGSELLYLLQKHGYRARIDLIDAKKQWLAETSRGRALS